MCVRVRMRANLAAPSVFRQAVLCAVSDVILLLPRACQPLVNQIHAFCVCGCVGVWVRGYIQVFQSRSLSGRPSLD